MEIPPVGAEFFHPERRTNGRTDLTKLIFTSWQFCKCAKKWLDWHSLQREQRFEPVAVLYYLTFTSPAMFRLCTQGTCRCPQHRELLFAGSLPSI